MTRKILLFIAALATIFMFMSCSQDEQSDSVDTASAQIETAQTQTPQTQVVQTGIASEFVFAAKDLEGKVRQSTEWVGKQPVVLNFWGTWCPPCRKEIPDLIKAYEEFKPQGVEMVGLAVRDNVGSVTKFTAEKGMNWPMLMGDGALVARYRVSGVPTTIFIDSKGNEIGRFVGPQSYETFKQAFQAVLES